jgi:hypothetical protein
MSADKKFAGRFVYRPKYVDRTPESEDLTDHTT